jgi:hypothetical protein
VVVTGNVVVDKANNVFVIGNVVIVTIKVVVVTGTA